MKIAAIIAEYNPFHNGHKFHIEETKRITGADYIIAIISGNFVQRGEPAIIDKYQRTTMALNNGIDLVLELPTYFACSSAEYFTYGAISILDKLGVVDYLCFGSECNNIELLNTIAKILANPSEDFTNYLNNCLKKGHSFPKSRELALLNQLKDNSNISTTEIKEIISSPNNILGIEYLKALNKLNSNITPITIHRNDNGYNNKTLSRDNKYTSASSIRIACNTHDTITNIKNFVPDNVYTILNKQYKKIFPIYYNDLSNIALYNLLTCKTKDITRYLDVDDVIANKLLNNVSSSSNITELLDNCKSKDITYSRLSRALLHIIIKLEADKFSSYINTDIEYARILGFKSSASNVIKNIKKKSSLTLINKLSLGKKELSGPSLESLNYDILTTEIYNKLVSLKYGNNIDNEYKRGMIII